MTDLLTDLSTPARLERVGLRPPHPVRSDWPAFQKVGHALAAEGRHPLSLHRPATAGDALATFRLGRLIAGVSPIPAPHRQVEPPQVPRGMRT